MKKNIYISLVLPAAFVLFSCEGTVNKTIVGSGPVESMEVVVPAFKGVNVTGTCNVVIRIGEPQVLEFYAQSEILEILTYEVEDEILEIGFEKGYSIKSSEEILAVITIPLLEFTGITGTGDYELSGAQQERLDIFVTGVGNVFAFDMPVNTCNIRISGTSNIQVHANELLDVVISGVGNISYRGNPDINTTISGVGNVTPAGN